jgi:hypothetical protein
MPHRGGIRQIAMTPDGHQVAILSKDLAVARVPDPGGPPARAPERLEATWTRRGVQAMAVDPGNQRVAVVGAKPGVAVLDLRDGRSLENLPGRGRALAWSPDGRRLAVLEPRKDGFDLRITRPDSGAAPDQVIAIGPNLEMFPPAFAFSPDGRTIAIHRSALVELWSIADDAGAAVEPRLRDAFLVPYGRNGPDGGLPPPALAFTPDGRRLAVGDGQLELLALDGTRRRWSLGRGGGATYERAFAIPPSGGNLVASTARGLFVWELPEPGPDLSRR